MIFKVLELKGYKSLRAFNAFNALMLGMKMLPAYMSQDYEEFLGNVQKMDPLGQERVLTEAVMFVELQKEEVEAILCFCADPNGVPISKENQKNLGPSELTSAIVAVCMEIAKIKIDLVSENEKKK